MKPYYYEEVLKNLDQIKTVVIRHNSRLADVAMLALILGDRLWDVVIEFVEGKSANDEQWAKWMEEKVLVINVGPYGPNEDNNYCDETSPLGFFIKVAEVLGLDISDQGLDLAYALGQDKKDGSLKKAPHNLSMLTRSGTEAFAFQGDARTEIGLIRHVAFAIFEVITTQEQCSDEVLVGKLPEFAAIPEFAPLFERLGSAPKKEIPRALTIMGSLFHGWIMNQPMDYLVQRTEFFLTTESTYRELGDQKQFPELWDKAYKETFANGRAIVVRTNNPQLIRMFFRDRNPDSMRVEVVVQVRQDPDKRCRNVAIFTRDTANVNLLRLTALLQALEPIRWSSGRGGKALLNSADIFATHVNVAQIKKLIELLVLETGAMDESGFVAFVGELINQLPDEEKKSCGTAEAVVSKAFPEGYIGRKLTYRAPQERVEESDDRRGKRRDSGLRYRLTFTGLSRKARRAEERDKEDAVRDRKEAAQRNPQSDPRVALKNRLDQMAEENAKA